MYKHQLESADLQLFAVRQLMLIDTLTLDIRAVQRTDITHQIARPVAPNFRVPTGDRDVVQKDDAVGVSPHCHDIGVERIAGSRFRSVKHDKESFVNPECRTINAHTAAIQIDCNMICRHLISSE